MKFFMSLFHISGQNYITRSSVTLYQYRGGVVFYFRFR